MKTELIKQLEAKKFNNENDLLSCARDVGIDIAIEIINALPEPIRAKALKKGGTSYYYDFDGAIGDYIVRGYPEILSETDIKLLKENTILPANAELLDIEIYIKPKA